MQTKEITKKRYAFGELFREALADMNFIDCLLLTFGNIVLCLSFPKLLSLISASKTQKTQKVKPIVAAPVIESEVANLLPLES